MTPGKETLAETLRASSIGTVLGLTGHYAWFYASGSPLLTDRIAEWIMARTPSRYAVWILDRLGPWGKPSAMTGALATLGFAAFLIRRSGCLTSYRWRIPAIAGTAFAAATVVSFAFDYRWLTGEISFWLPLTGFLALCLWQKRGAVKPTGSAAPHLDAMRLEAPVEARREFLAAVTRYGLPLAMSGGVAAVAAESYFREEVLARRASNPVDLFPFHPPVDDDFAQGLVRPLITPVPQFYGMSKNTVDPVIDVRNWRLTVSLDGWPVRRFRYGDLFALRNRDLRFVTLRCISNTLKSDLMGTAEWAGLRLSQLIDPNAIPSRMIEVAFIGVEGHDDSMSLDYAFGEETLLAFGMNGKTLSRTHGFPLRLLAPRYYGCRNVKWIGEIRFVSKPYYGTWQRLGYTKEPRIHTASHIDRMLRVDGRLRFGGVSFAGSRGIRAVRVRSNGGPWSEAKLERPLSAYTWTRWIAELPAASGDTLEANAQDGFGAWQELAEASPFPAGPIGPTIVKVRV